jgi:hypothetical protein
VGTVHGNELIVRRTTVAATISIAVLEEVPMPVLGCDNEDEVHTAGCGEAPCNVSKKLKDTRRTLFKLRVILITEVLLLTSNMHCRDVKMFAVQRED